MSVRLPVPRRGHGPVITAHARHHCLPSCVIHLGMGPGIDAAAARHAPMWQSHGVRGMGGSAPQRSSPQRKITFCYGDVLHRSRYGDREECADATRA